MTDITDIRYYATRLDDDHGGQLDKALRADRYLPLDATRPYSMICHLVSRLLCRYTSPRLPGLFCQLPFLLGMRFVTWSQL